MSEFVIPRKERLNQLSSKISDNIDPVLLQSIPGDLNNMIQCHINAQDMEISDTISKMLENKIQYVEKYIKDVSATYNNIMKAISEVISGKNGGKLLFIIPGTGTPGEFGAIDVVVGNLKNNGWTPKKEQTYQYFDDGLWEGKTQIVLSCDFN